MTGGPMFALMGAMVNAGLNSDVARGLGDGKLDGAIFTMQSAGNERYNYTYTPSGHEQATAVRLEAQALMSRLSPEWAAKLHAELTALAAARTSALRSRRVKFSFLQNRTARVNPSSRGPLSSQAAVSLGGRLGEPIPQDELLAQRVFSISGLVR
jgi:hypothetical protein